MDLSGNNKTKISDIHMGNICIQDVYIYYLVYESEAHYGTLYRMKLDGSSSEKVKTRHKVSTFNMDDKYIYYTNEEYHIYKMKIDGSEESKITRFTHQTSSTINLIDNNAYCGDTWGLGYKYNSKDDSLVDLYEKYGDIIEW